MVATKELPLILVIGICSANFLEEFFSETGLPVFGVLRNPFAYARIPIRHQGGGSWLLANGLLGNLEAA